MTLALRIVVALTICISTRPAVARPVVWMCSTADQPWQTRPAPEFTPTPTTQPAEIRLVPSRTRQTIDGFGGCVNELGWIALNKLSARD
jgi:glucosylceramidase